MKTLLSIFAAALLLIATPAFANGPLFKEKKPAPPKAPVVVDNRFDLDEARAEVAKRRKLLDAIQAVETGDEKDPSKAVSADKTRRGWFLINREIYDDAVKAYRGSTRGLDNYVSTARDLERSRICVVCFWHQYPEAKSDKTLALVWHYGPSAMPGTRVFNEDKDKFWTRVQAAMKANEAKK